MRGIYNPDEDEFEAKTFFSHSPDAEPGELTPVSKKIKQLFGFLYLRALRTGSRALSLERGSLLDIILRLKGVRAGIWEKAIDRLKTLDIEQDTPALTAVLKSIEQRLARYMPSHAEGRSTRLYVSQLTRADLRETMAFFLAMSKDQRHVPFRRAGTGTVNTLVLALLSFIAELKPNSVIFAMEEPEVALPPHTQRRIADYLLKHTTQAFVTSHSPFVIERFSPSQTLLLSRGDDATVTTKRVSDAAGLKDNDFRRYARRGLTECMIGTGAIVVEGLTEFHALPVVARRLEESNTMLQPLDIAGVAFFDAESDGSMPKFGNFFRSLGLMTFSFYDNKARSAEAKKRFTESFEIDCEHQYAGFEDLVITEVPTERLWSFLRDLQELAPDALTGLPTERPNDQAVRKIMRGILCGNKGAAWTARLFEECSMSELPATVVEFLQQVYALFPKPPEAQLPIEEAATRVTA
jgi:putative ATP-dependent endonuclease of the OLD family